jgi:hydrogenase expression/formation protein HypC
MQLVEHHGQTGIAETDGIRREVSLMLLPQKSKLGDWVLVHAGFAITQVDESEAQQTLSLLREAKEKGVLKWGGEE